MSKPKMSTESYIENIKNIWPDCPYDLALVIWNGGGTKIKLICPTHGEFKKWSGEIREKKLCPKCAPKKGVKQGYKQSEEHIKNRISKINYKRGHISHNRLDTHDFTSKLSEKWSDCPYDLSKLVYVTAKHKIILICKKHGEFKKWPGDVLNQSKCPKCSGVGFEPDYYLKELVNRFPQYDFAKAVYKTARAPLLVRCSVHKITFKASRNAFLNANKRCPACTKEDTLANRIAAGRAKDPRLLTEWEKYKRKVWAETNKTYRVHRETLGERNMENHLDHNYSILHGFNNNVSPKILGNLVNLRIISSKQNRKKEFK